MNCHTLLGNGAYYAPDLTKAWLDPGWVVESIREEQMVAFLMDPETNAQLSRRISMTSKSKSPARAASMDPGEALASKPNAMTANMLNRKVVLLIGFIIEYTRTKTKT